MVKRVGALGVALGAILVGCSSGTASKPPPTTAAPMVTASATAPAPTTTTTPPRQATVTGPITMGTKGPELADRDVAGAGYRESEYFIAGTAQAYKPVGRLGADGRWTVAPGQTAAYKTRLLVRRPVDAVRFNGTVIVEWLNVTVGRDNAPDWTFTAPELERSGFAWVGVSAQQVGVQGFGASGPNPLAAGTGTGGVLKNFDPVRYGSLVHPGDQYAYDIFTQAAGALRRSGRVDPLAGLRPRHLIAIGDSQSAFFLTSYVDAVQPITHTFDGFLIHSRGGGAAGFDGSGSLQDGLTGGVRIRDDAGVPVLVFETETDLSTLDYFPARQADTADFRLWEVAGTSHADYYEVGRSDNAAAILGCREPINTGPQFAVLRAAVAHLSAWVDGGPPPSSAPRLHVVPGQPPVILRNGVGDAMGGIRTPLVDVPAATLSGAPNIGSMGCFLFGLTRPFSSAALTARYTTKSAYLGAFDAATRDAVRAGYVLPADVGELRARAEKVEF
jgi:hypothetical protein